MKKKLIIVFLVFTAIGVGLFYLLTMGNIGVKYDTAPVVKGEVGSYVQDVGRISSRNIRRYYGNGINKVEEMTLKLGDRVTKGQLILKYEDDMELNLELNMEIIDLNKEVMNLEIHKVEKQIEALEAAYDDAQSGTDMESVNNARIEISRIQSQVDSATKDQVRMQALYDEGIATLIELEQSVEKIQELESNLSIAQNTYNQLAKGISDSMRKKYEAEIDALILSIDIIEKNIDILEKNRQETRDDIQDQNQENKDIYADVDGIVTQVNTFQGDRPSAGILLVEIHDPTEKVVLVDFMVEDAIKVSPGQAADVQDTGLNLSIADLKVDRVYPNAFVTLSELGVEENRQTVEIGLGSQAESLPFGLEVKTKVLIDPPRETLLVPTGAVVEYGGRKYVEVLEDGEPVEREITTGITINGTIEVFEGVEEGEQVILNYQED